MGRLAQEFPPRPLLFLLTPNRLRALFAPRSLTDRLPSRFGRREGAREELNSDKKDLHSRKNGEGAAAVGVDGGAPELSRLPPLPLLIATRSPNDHPCQKRKA